MKAFNPFVHEGKNRNHFPALYLKESSRKWFPSDVIDYNHKRRLPFWYLLCIEKFL